MAGVASLRVPHLHRDELNNDCTEGLGHPRGLHIPWAFELDYDGADPAGDPGRPFDGLRPDDRQAERVGTWAERAPANIIGKSTNQVNWGLLAYSSTADDTCNDPQGTTSNKLVTAINPTGTDVSEILAAMRLLRDGGLPVGGGTPTQAALEKAQQQLIDTFAIDPLYHCLRTYGVILVTDGESNICNDGAVPGKPWASPGTAAAAACLRTGADNWKSFPPASRRTSGTCPDDSVRRQGAAAGRLRSDQPEDLGHRVRFRRRAKCELNYTAYKGRTDANSPGGRRRLHCNKDPRLWSCTATDADGTCTAWTDAPYDGSQDYAFFADDTRGARRRVREDHVRGRQGRLRDGRSRSRARLGVRHGPGQLRHPLLDRVPGVGGAPLQVRLHEVLAGRKPPAGLPGLGRGRHPRGPRRDHAPHLHVESFER